MGYYRVENAKSGRAVCKDANCKVNQIKIDKGEIRFGTLVEIMGNSSWTWKHWGCVTPAQIKNLKESIGDDPDDIDGIDEIPETDKVKVRRAVEQGHVDDSDWKGDPEYNRFKPGQKGTRPRTPKKPKAKAEDIDLESGVESPTVEKPKSRKRSRKDNQDAVNETAAKAKLKKRNREEAKSEDENDHVPVPTAKKRKGSEKAATETTNGDLATSKEQANHEQDHLAPNPRKKSKQKSGEDMRTKPVQVSKKLAPKASEESEPVATKGQAKEKSRLAKSQADPKSTRRSTRTK